MGSVLTKLLDYGGFRDCGCAPGFPPKEEEGERYLRADAIFSSREQNIIKLKLVVGIEYKHIKQVCGNVFVGR